MNLEDYINYTCFPPVILKEPVGKVWKIKRKAFKSHVYDPDGEWRATFRWPSYAERYATTLMNKNDVIAYH